MKYNLKKNKWEDFFEDSYAIPVGYFENIRLMRQSLKIRLLDGSPIYVNSNNWCWILKMNDKICMICFWNKVYW